MTGLAVVSPAVGLSGADTVKTGESGDLAEPATDEDVLEVVSVTRGEDLTERARVELVDHLAVGGDNTVLGVGLELSVIGKSLQAQLGAPGVNDSLVAGGGRRRSRGGGGGSSLGGRRSGCLRVLNNLGGGRCRCLRVLNDLGAGGGRGVLLVDNGGSYSRSLVGGGGSLGGLSVLLLAPSIVDGVNNSLVNDVNVLNLLVLGLGPVGCCESRAGKGEDGSGGAHFDCFG